MPSAKTTVRTIAKLKADRVRIVCLTAYDFTSAQLADECGVDIILVGDSLGNVVMGQKTTLGVSLEAMEHHVKAVSAGVTTALVVADLPFGTYQSSVAQAVDSSVRLMKAGAEAVKLEGDYPDVVVALERAGIPTMGHVGFTPQSVHKFGGHRVQGRNHDGHGVAKMAQALDHAGVFAMVLELMPSALAKQVTSNCQSATIGIGAGPDCDGEIQVWHDVLGLSVQTFRHSKAFLDGRLLIGDALKSYCKEVRHNTFPTEDNSF